MTAAPLPPRNPAPAPTPPRPFGAVGVALVTPFTADGERLDLDAAQRLAAHAVQIGNDQLVVSGTTGEAPTLSDTEKVQLVRAVREAVPTEVSVLAGVGTYDTRHSTQLARAHADLGLDGLLVVTPYYSKPTQAGVIAHIEAIAAATDLPLMLYDIPGRTATALSTETLLRLGEHPRIVAVKDATGDLHRACMVMQRTGLAYYSGDDAVNLPWLAVGASGVVSVVSQVAGQLTRRLVDATDRNDLHTARDAHIQLVPLVEAIMNHIPGAVAAKTALMHQGVLPHAQVRSPLAAATADQEKLLTAAIAAANGITPLDQKDIS